MGRKDAVYSARPDEADEVGFGSWPPPGRRRSRWLPIAGVGALVAVLAVVAIGHRGKPAPPAPPPQPHLPFGVTDMGHPLLGVRAGWELYGYGPAGVARIQFARGRITWTDVPALASNGPLAFIASSGQVIIRPIDGVPGYAVPDGGHARTLTGALGDGGTVIPGPRPGTLWIQPGFGAATMPLVYTDGRAAGISMRLPKGGPWLVNPDGRGYALITGNLPGINYDLSPGHTRRVAGDLVAVGPTGLLTAGCDPGPRCSFAVVDPATGARRPLPGPSWNPGPDQASGVIAPNGSTAAAVQVAGQHATLHLINLATGADQRIAVPLSPGSDFGQILAWSPDSRWLFVVTGDGGLAAVNARTQHVQGLGFALPLLTQIAVPG